MVSVFFFFVINNCFVYIRLAFDAESQHFNMCSINELPKNKRNDGEKYLIFLLRNKKKLKNGYQKTTQKWISKKNTFLLLFILKISIKIEHFVKSNRTYNFGYNDPLHIKKIAVLSVINYNLN